MNSRLAIGVLAALTCAVFAVYVAIKPSDARDLSGLARAAALGQIQTYSDDAVWANDFHAIEPALRAAAGVGEIRLMTGGTCVGTYSRRAGIQTRESP